MDLLSTTALSRMNIPVFYTNTNPMYEYKQCAMRYPDPKQRKTTALFPLSKDSYDAAATDLPKENV